MDHFSELLTLCSLLVLHFSELLTLGSGSGHSYMVVVCVMPLSTSGSCCVCVCSTALYCVLTTATAQTVAEEKLADGSCTPEDLCFSIQVGLRLHCPCCDAAQASEYFTVCTL